MRTPDAVYTFTGAFRFLSNITTNGDVRRDGTCVMGRDREELIGYAVRDADVALRLLPVVRRRAQALRRQAR